MSFEATSERRKFDRFQIMDEASVCKDGATEAHNCEVVNVSLMGLQLRSEKPIPVGGSCVLKIAPGSQAEFQIRGEVRYTHKAEDGEFYSSGFRFVPETAQQQGAIAKYVHSAFLRQGSDGAPSGKSAA